MGVLKQVRTRAFQTSMGPTERQLAKLKSGQREAFSSLSKRHSADFESWRKVPIDKFTTPLWKDFVAGLEPILAPIPPFSFLRDPTIQKTMFVSGRNKWLDTEIGFLESRFDGDRLKELIIEDYAGDPPLSSKKYLTSHNSIHHLYHLARYAQRTGVDIEKVRSVVEWGGGYGNLAKIFRRLSGDGLTYVIVDLPLFSLLQWTYLATVIGEENVHLVSTPEVGLRNGMVNVVPLCFVEGLDLFCELFVSTWALSESSTFSQDFVQERKWFGAKHILLAYQDSDKLLPDAGRVERLAKAEGLTVEDIEFLPGNHYAFR